MLYFYINLLIKSANSLCKFLYKNDGIYNIPKLNDTYLFAAILNISKLHNECADLIRSQIQNR